MKWIKLGKIFDPNDHKLPHNCLEFSQAPQALIMNDRVRVYFSTREKDAAEKWCRENGYEYLLIEPNKLSSEEILKLYNSGEIKFTDRYEQKFKERYLKENNSG